MLNKFYLYLFVLLSDCLLYFSNPSTVYLAFKNSFLFSMALFFTAFYERIFIIKRGMFKLVEVFCCCSLVSLAFFFLFFFFLFCLSFSCWEGSSDGNALTSRENLPGGVLSADKLPLQHFLDQLQRLN